MKRIFGALVISLLIFSPVLAKTLKKLNLDDVSSATPVINSDSEIKTEGKASVRVTVRWPATIFIGEAKDLNIENAKLIYKADVKSDIRGAAYLEMWVHMGGARYFSRGVNDPVQGKSGWKTIQTPFILQKGQRAEKITLNLAIEGEGTVWIDNIVLSKESLE